VAAPETPVTPMAWAALTCVCSSLTSWPARYTSWPDLWFSSQSWLCPRSDTAPWRSRARVLPARQGLVR